MSDLVIWFFELIELMVRNPDAKRTLDWRIRCFNRLVEAVDPRSQLYPLAVQMSEELALCRRRRRSRRLFYNVSNIDEVSTQYRIHKSPETLSAAWEVFLRGAYKTRDGTPDAV